MPRHFWAFEESGGVSTLRLDGPIAEESWWGDEMTPAQFRAELAAHPGDLMVYINSPGGDVCAASQMYAALKDHPGKITIRIDGLAASAASIVAMAGDVVEMAPAAYMMIHNSATVAMGNAREMEQATAMLREVDKGIRAVYAAKTGKSERELARMMEAETWMSAPTALAEGFIDAIAYAQDTGKESDAEAGMSAFGAAASSAASEIAEACTTASTAMGSTAARAAAAAHTHTIGSHTHALWHTHSLPDATPAATVAPAAFSARKMRENVTAAVVASAGKQPEFLGKRLNVPEAASSTQTTEADAALRARLRLLSM